MIASALLAAVLTAAQAPPGPASGKPDVAPPAGSEQERDGAQIRVRVELVTAPVAVRDSRGELVFDLVQEHFRIYDNGVLQKIESFDLGGDPLSVVFVVERSSRIEPLLPAVRRTGILFTQTILGQTGDGAIIAFDDTSDIVVPFTADHDRIEKAMADLKVGRSGARLHDALSRAVGLLRNRTPDRRRAIVVLAEAKDTGSETKLGEVLRDAQLNNISIYSVGLSTTAAMLRSEPRSTGPAPITPPGTFPLPPRPGTPQTPTTEAQARGQMDLMAAIIWMVERAADAKGQNSLELATTATGGLHLPTFRDRSIERALDQIGAELHAQYIISYRPTGRAAQESGFHKIDVEVARPGVTVRTRPGYFIGKEEK
ncbi:MAG TPA: VWA domain-containing protein [Candidatus Acidoferrales bacterium]